MNSKHAASPIIPRGSGRTKSQAFTRRQVIGLSTGGLMGSAGVAAGVEPQNAGNRWTTVLTLNRERQCAAGTAEALVGAIRNGADLRISTEFIFNQHIDTDSDNDELVEEVSEFHITYLVDDRWCAGIMTQRQPVELPNGFGPRPSMSFFLYNQDGQQALGRPHLDGAPGNGTLGPSPLPELASMPKMRWLDHWDADTNAPSTNFVYDFEAYRYSVRDDWREVLSHGPDGAVVSGSYEVLAEASRAGAQVKVAIRGLCADLSKDTSAAVEHEVFVEAGWVYNQTKSKLFSAALHPVVRVAPAIPIRYRSKNWDFGWLLVRTDGFIARWLVDPYSLKFSKSETRHALRWFVRL